MKAGELMIGMAKATGTDEATVRVAMRALREAGYLTTGARGVNAPDMTPLDAARLLLALMMSERPTYAAAALADLITFPLDRKALEHLSDAEFSEEEAYHQSIDQCVADLIQTFAFERDGELFQSHMVEGGSLGKMLPICSIEVDRSRLIATVSAFGLMNTYSYWSRKGKDNFDVPAYETIRDKYNSRLRVKCEVMTDVINEISLLFVIDNTPDSPS